MQKNSKEIIECIKKFGIAYVPNYIEKRPISYKKIFYECFDKIKIEKWLLTGIINIQQTQVNNY